MCLFWIGSVIKLNQQGKSICLLWINTYVLLQSVFPAAGGDVIQSQIQFPCLYNVETCDLVQCVTILCKMWIYGTIIEYISFSAQLIHSYWLKCFPGICWCKNNLDVADVSLCWTYCTVFKQTCITRTVEEDGLLVFSHIITETEKGKPPWNVWGLILQQLTVTVQLPQCRHPPRCGCWGPFPGCWISLQEAPRGRKRDPCLLSFPDGLDWSWTF